jgi:hypothetical protein
MSENIAKMLAQVTAGSTIKPNIGGGGSVRTVNMVMGALGMGKAGRAGTLILLANYCEDESARRWAEGWLARWSWITWLKVGDPDANISVNQMKKLVSVALGQHIDPEAGRRTSLKAIAELVGINHQTYSKKYRRHFQRLKAEIAYQEAEAISALHRHLGGIRK